MRILVVGPSGFPGRARRLAAAGWTLDEAVAAWGPRAMDPQLERRHARRADLPRPRMDTAVDDIEGDIRRLAGKLG